MELEEKVKMREVRKVAKLNVNDNVTQTDDENQAKI